MSSTLLLLAECWRTRARVVVGLVVVLAVLATAAGCGSAVDKQASDEQGLDEPSLDEQALDEPALDENSLAPAELAFAAADSAPDADGGPDSGDPEREGAAVPAEEPASIPAESIPAVSIRPVPVEPLAATPNDLTLRIGLDHPNLQRVDPARVSTPSEAIAADVLFDGLTNAVAGTSVVRSELAESWGTRGDERLWEFVLGSHTWSDGWPLQAADVKGSIERAVAAAPDAPHVQALSGLSGWQDFVDGSSDEISGIRAVNLATVHISLDEPADLPRLLADVHFGIVGPAGIQQRSGQWEVVQAGTDRLVMQHPAPEEVEFPHLELITVDDPAQLSVALATGTLDVAVTPSPNSPDLSWRLGLGWITTRPDGSFDVSAVTASETPVR